MIEFPSIDTAMREPNGLLASGGDLSASTLLTAYQQGIFPWSNEGEPLLWWSPDPRATIRPQDVHVSRSLRKSMRRFAYRLSVDTAFSKVIEACAETQENRNETWINPDMITAYNTLHDLGYAHSIEVWDQKHRLIGGLYGLAIADVFCGESMFHRETDASKMAFIALCKQLQNAQFKLIDCQIENPHLSSLGVTNMPRAEFKQYLPAYTQPSHLIQPLHPAQGYHLTQTKQQKSDTKYKASATIKRNSHVNNLQILIWETLAWKTTKDLVNDLV